MLLSVGSARTVSIDLRLAVSLSLLAGAINAAGFRSLGFFSGNMTGNVSSLSDYLALTQWTLAAWALSLIVAFIAGAFTSALLIEVGQRRRIRGIYAYSIMTEAALLALLACVDYLVPETHSDPLVLVGVAFVMGLQNSATTRISDARVRTTHVTGIATDIGVELAVLLGGARADAGRSVMIDRLRLHLLTIGAFLGGGVAGVLIYGRIGPGLFVLISIALLALALPEARRARAHGAGAA